MPIDSCKKSEEKNYFSKNMSDSAASSELTFFDAADQWLTVQKVLVKPSTYNKYRNLIRTYLIAELGSLSIENLTNDCIESHCLGLLQNGRKDGEGLSSKTVQEILGITRRILEYAERFGYKNSKNGKFLRLKHHEKELRVLTIFEQNTLIEYLLLHLDEKNLGILFCLFTGLRVGEICALKWEDISFSDNTVHIHKTLQRIQLAEEGVAGQKTKVVESTPKSNSSNRIIPLPDNLVKLLEPFEKRGYLLSSDDSTYIEPRIMQNHVKKVLRDCKIPEVNFHVLRHTFATRCVELQMDAKSLSEILGHSNVNITLNRYVHPSMELKRQNMTKLAKLMEQHQSP